MGRASQNGGTFDSYGQSCWHPCRGAGFWRILNRGCRFAQPPATGCLPAGKKIDGRTGGQLAVPATGCLPAGKITDGRTGAQFAVLATGCLPAGKKTDERTGGQLAVPATGCLPAGKQTIGLGVFPFSGMSFVSLKSGSLKTDMSLKLAIVGRRQRHSVTRRES